LFWSGVPERIAGAGGDDGDPEERREPELDSDNQRDSPTAAEAKRLSTENLVLKRVLADLLAGSGLDWYGDERLREIMDRVGEF
jgi:hypothetical protein